MFQRKEREVVTGPEAKNVRLKNNLWLLKGRVWRSELRDPQVVFLADSGGRSAHAQCVCVCAPEPVRKPTAKPWGPPWDCCDQSGGGDATKLASRFYGGLAETPPSTPCKWGNNSFESLCPAKELKIFNTLRV